MGKLALTRRVGQSVRIGRAGLLRVVEISPDGVVFLALHTEE